MYLCYNTLIQQGGIRAVGVSVRPSCDTIFVGGSRGTGAILRRPTGQATWGSVNVPLSHPGGTIFSVVPSTDSWYICSSGGGMKIDDGGNKLATFFGHEGRVSSIDNQGDLVATGGWDGKMIVWLKDQKIAEHPQHQYAVCCRFLPNDFLISGSQDGCIRLFLKGVETYVGQNSHDGLVRAIRAHPRREDIFLSVGNDGFLRIWKINPTNQTFSFVSEHQLCDNFIYDLICSNLSDGVIYTSDERKIVTKWFLTDNLSGITRIAEMFHPCDVMSICEHPVYGDVICGCSDGYLRIWTFQEEKALRGTELLEFEKSFVKPKQSVSAVEKGLGSAVVDASQIDSLRGKKDGEVKVFKDGSSLKAFCWSDAQQKWELVGDVLEEGVPQETEVAENPNYYEGDDFFPAGNYDHIISVEVGENGPMKKLPYNNGKDHMQVAEKFLAREKLGKTYLMEIINFLKANTAPKKDYARPTDATTTPAPAPPPQVQVQNKPQRAEEVLREYVILQSFTLGPVQNKILEFNAQQDAVRKMNTGDLAIFDNSIEKLKPIDWKAQEIPAATFRLLFEKLGSWEPKFAFPVLDLWRILILHNNSPSALRKLEGGPWTLVEHLLHNFRSTETQFLPHRRISVLRCLVNLFDLPSNRQIVEKYSTQIYQEIFETLSRDPTTSNIARLVVTACFNFCILLSERKGKFVGGGEKLAIGNVVNCLRLSSSVSDLGEPSLQNMAESLYILADLQCTDTSKLGWFRQHLGVLSRSNSPTAKASADKLRNLAF